jgi:DNA ligase-1
MLLSTLVEAWEKVASTRSRTTKTEIIAAVLRQAAPDEVEVVTAYLAGTLPQRRTGVGWRGLTELPEPTTESTLTVAEVDAAFTETAALAGTGSQRRRADAVATLFGRATAAEQGYLRALVTGELRQGALDSLVVDAVAVAAGVSKASVRRAAMLRGATGAVAVAALTDGEAGLARLHVTVGRPVRPMLAASAPDVVAGFAKAAPEGGMVAVDCKLDGIRVQVHKAEGVVQVFTRSLEDITDRVPEVVEAAQALPVARLVLDGEAIALDGDGRPRAFQETGARVASRLDVDTLRRQVPLTAYFFDMLHVDGDDLLDQPGSVRLERLTRTVPADLVVPRLLTDDSGEAADWFADLVSHGHEGVVVKNLEAPYEAGRRGSAWVKVKPRHTLDLVVLAVEWGSGRRRGWLSNIHLGARDPGSKTGFAMLGKTFKGMTDEMLAWQTERFLALETSRSGHVVHVRPEQVVEVAFDGIQTSTRYASGMALRFARVIRYRDDKTAGEADTIETVRSLRTG